MRSLADVWRDQKARLETTDALRTFTERLQRKWAIETGITERVYTLDRGIRQLLIEHGIDASLIPEEATDRDPQVVGVDSRPPRRKSTRYVVPWRSRPSSRR